MSQLTSLGRVINILITSSPMVDLVKMALQTELNNYMIDSTIKNFQMDHKIKKLELQIDQINNKLNNNYYNKGS